MLGIGGGESYVIKQSGLRIQRDHTLDIESVLLANAVKGRVLIVDVAEMTIHIWYQGINYGVKNVIRSTRECSFLYITVHSH
jgi:hypothetical protein